MADEKHNQDEPKTPAANGGHELVGEQPETGATAEQMFGPLLGGEPHSASPEPEAKTAAEEEPEPRVEEPRAIDLVEAYAVKAGASSTPAPEAAAAEAAEPVFEMFTAAEPNAPAPTNPASVQAPQPVVVHPPVPAAQLPPLADEPVTTKSEDEKRVPFYKREISLGRKRDAKTKPERKEKRERSSFSLPKPQPRTSRSGGKLPKHLVGLKVGASQIAAATVANNGHAEVLQAAREDLQSGIVVSGELREPDALAEALREFFKKHKLPKRGVRLGIGTNRIGVRTLDIVGIDDPKQLANAIKFRAQEALPIPIDEAVLDYQVLSEGTNDEGEKTRKILLVLAYRDLIDRYVTACRKAGIALAGIDLEAFALLRALAAPREDDAPAQAALVAVTIGHERTTFAVSDGRVCEFTRVLDWGGVNLNVALARALDRTPSEVEDAKRALSLHGVEIPEGLTQEQAQVARDALRKQVQTFARELVSSLQFYQNQPGSLGIGEIVVTGGTAHLAGLADELQRLIGVRVREGNPLVRVKVGKRFKEPEQLGSLAVAIGLGIED